jgi:hypothetical protein
MEQSATASLTRQATFLPQKTIMPAIKSPRHADVRFWVIWNGQHTKIHLRPDQTVTMCHGGPTDEGWSSVSAEYEYDWEEQAIHRLFVSDGRDCDGRLTSCEESSCPIAELHSEEESLLVGDWVESSELIMVPRWSTRNRSQRDYAAEAMGY